MQIILKCKYTYGSVGFRAERIEGLPVDERHYEIAGGQVVLSGEDFIIHHDADVLLATPNNVYRMPTPAEQEQMAQAQEQASIVQENEPPAQKSKKQNGGG